MNEPVAASPYASAVAGPAAPADYERLKAAGAERFETHCGVCHGLDGASRVGPPLDHLNNRRVGAIPSYAYSAALSGREETWSDERLAHFLKDPDAEFRGTIMSPKTMSGEDITAIVAFLHES